MEEKKIWIETSVKNIAEKTFNGRPYKTKSGEEKVPELRTIRLYLGTGDDKKVGKISVRDETVIRARDLNDKDRPIIPGKYVFPLNPEQEYTVHFSEPTGNQIPHPETGEMVNEWKDVSVKMTGQQIKDGVMENKRGLAEERATTGKEEKKEEAPSEEDPDKDKPKKTAKKGR